MAAAWGTFLLMLVLGLAPANAQDPGTLNPEPLPPLPKSQRVELFARKPTPLPGPPRSIGSYGDGCLAGAVALPISGPSWQVMRQSRNRYWGNPSLVPARERAFGE
jgi:penicillin-insensitive murein endopeptidase